MAEEKKFPVLKLKALRLNRIADDERENKKVINQYDFSIRSIPETPHILNKHYEGVKVKRRSYKTNDYVIIENNGDYFVVIRILSKSKGKTRYLPLVIDLDNFSKVRNYTVSDNTGNWNVTNEYVTFSRKKNGKSYYLHNVLMNITPLGPGKDSIDHLNRVQLDNRIQNLKVKTQSNQNVNQKIRKCSSKQLEKMPEPYRTYYLKNRPRYIYWLYSKTHGHRIFAGPVGPIKEKKFSSKNPDMIPKLLQKAEEYLMEQAVQMGMKKWQITSELDDVSRKLKKEYDQIVGKAAKIIHLDL